MSIQGGSPRWRPADIRANRFWECARVWKFWKSIRRFQSKRADRPVQGAGSQIRRQWAEDPPAGMSKCLLNVQQISRYTTEDPAARGPGPEIRRPV
eukprot:1865283-Lingulodinium_polyedra.AAC.1